MFGLSEVYEKSFEYRNCRAEIFTVVDVFTKKISYYRVYVFNRKYKPGNYSCNFVIEPKTGLNMWRLSFIGAAIKVGGL